jgi:hypothetical protein
MSVAQVNNFARAITWNNAVMPARCIEVDSGGRRSACSAWRPHMLLAATAPASGPSTRLPPTPSPTSIPGRLFFPAEFKCNRCQDGYSLTGGVCKLLNQGSKCNRTLRYGQYCARVGTPHSTCTSHGAGCQRSSRLQQAPSFLQRGSQSSLERRQQLRRAVRGRWLRGASAAVGRGRLAQAAAGGAEAPSCLLIRPRSASPTTPTDARPATARVAWSTGSAPCRAACCECCCRSLSPALPTTSFLAARL